MDFPNDLEQTLNDKTLVMTLGLVLLFYLSQ